MKKEEIFRAIDQCEDKFLQEVLDEKEGKKHRSGRIFDTTKIPATAKMGRRAAAVALICAGICGAGVAMTAAASDRFRDWLTGMFGEQAVSEVKLEPVENAQKPDIMADADNAFSIKTNMEIYGERESFVCECYEEDEKVGKVYTIQGNGMKEREISAFHGEYDGVPFTFQYVIENNEICGFNYEGDVEEIFPSVQNKEIVHAALSHVNKKNDTVEKECIASLNLKTGEVQKLTGDDMICNFITSPNGKVILCNHRADAYWSAFDLVTGKERKIDSIDGYNRRKDIHFLDDYHILTLGKPFMKGDTEWYSTFEINLQTGEVTKEYKDFGEIGMEWSYTQKKEQLKLHRITNNDTMEIDNVTTPVHIITSDGDYALFGAQEDGADFYLVNLKKKSYKKMEFPKAVQGDMELYLASAQKKLLVSSGSRAYLVDVSEM